MPSCARTADRASTTYWLVGRVQWRHPSGDDLLYGDALSGQEGQGDDDTLFGESGDDEIIGDSGFFNLNAMGGDDTLFGGSGNDRLHGDIRGPDLGAGGNDRLFGGLGSDLLFGDSGDDTLFGQWGADTLEGDDGADVFGFSAGHGGASLAAADLLTDFQDGVDRFALVGLDYGPAAGEASFLSAAAAGGSVADSLLVVSDGGGGFLEVHAVLQNVDVSSLDGTDILP